MLLPLAMIILATLSFGLILSIAKDWRERPWKRSRQFACRVETRELYGRPERRRLTS